MTNNPNHAPTTVEATPASPEARGLYSIDMVNEWRSSESSRLGGLRTDSIESGAFDDSYVTSYIEAIEDKLDEFLAAKGVTPDDPEYATLRQLYRDANIDRFNDNAWGNSPASRGVDANDTKSQSDKVEEIIRQWHDEQAEVAEDDEEEDTERTADVIRAELDEARDAWSSMQAKRQGRMWDRRIEGYNATKERYETLLRELGSRTLEGTITDDNLSDAEKNAAVLAYIFDEQNNLRAKTKEKVKNTRASRFIEKFGGWLSRGNNWVRFGKGAAVGLGAGLIGAGVGLLAGAAGIGAAVAGASTMVITGAARFTRLYAKSDAVAGRGMNEMDAAVLTGWRDGVNDQEGDDIITKAVALSNQQFEDDTRKEQGKRRKTTATAMGGMAVGAALGVGGGLLLDHLGVSDFVHDRIKIWGGDHDVDGSNGGSGGGGGGGGAETTEDVDWTTPALPNESFYVDYGHGYTHELVDLATANGQQLSGKDAWDLHLHLVDKFGPDYINIANSGGSDIYFDNGDVRLSTPGTASWENGVTEEVHNWMVLRGVWR